MRTISIRIDSDLETQLSETVETTGLTQSEVVRDALEKHLRILKFKKLRGKTVPYAEKLGFLTDEDVYRDIS